jgi:hypothetical protein
MKLGTSNNEIGSILHRAYEERETFTLTGKGITANFVAVRLNAEPCRLDTGRWFTSLDLEQVSDFSQVKPWNGEGRPPAGTICELKTDKADSWGRAEIMYSSSSAVVWRWEGLSGEFGSEWEFTRTRPIRTPEQIAAEERERGIEEMAKILGVVACDDYVAATALYDAGYRK